jgi:LuxR family maltose regulon positive regulatory protein
MMRGGNQEATWKGWVQALPAELVSVRPVLSVYYAFCLLPGELDAAEARLQDAERWLDPTAEMSERPQALLAETHPERSRRRVVVNEEEFRSVPGTIAVARAYRAGALGDLPGTLKYARQALDLLPASDRFWRGAADALLGIAYWTSGELEAAHRSIADGMANARLVSGVGTTTSFTYLLADIRMAQGRLREAARTCQQALRLVAEQGEPVPQGTAELHVLLSEVHLERNDLEAATECLLQSKELGAYAVIPEARHRWHVARARLTATQGNLDGALELFDQAERLYLAGPTPEDRPITALKALVWVDQGRVAEALDWAREQGLSADDDLSYLREFEHITLAKALLAEYGSTRVESCLHEVIGFLERLLHAAEAGGRKGHAIAILSLQALAHAAQGDTSLALAPLARALALAEPEGFVRVFVGEGPPMAALLQDAAEHGIAPKYVGQLRAAFGQVDGKTPMTQPMIEPLSDREIEVLRLLDTELSGPAIARKLMVSLNTLHTHTKHIYGKLGVNNRRAAVRRAETLDLL